MCGWALAGLAVDEHNTAWGCALATELTMPQMGYDMREGTVVRWLKSEGSEVEMGEPIAEIETDKAVVEFESYASGVLQTILVPEGTTVPVGQPIAVVGAEATAPTETPVEEPTPVPEERAIPLGAPPVEVEPRYDETSAAPVREVRASPVARRLAQERNIDLSQIEGSGPGGRVTRDDVLAYEGGPAAEAVATPEVVAPAPAETETPGPEPAVEPVEAVAPSMGAEAGQRVALSRMRQQIARVTVISKQEKPHFYISSEIDMTRAMELREQINRDLGNEGVRVTVNDLIIKACVETLKKHPKFNAFFHEDGIQMNEEINVGVAIADEEGLIVPAIMDCADRSLNDIAVASKDLAERTRSGTLRPQEYTGGTFAISNLGMFDVTSFIAIIQPPQTAVLAVGTVIKKPVVRDDEIAIAQMMTATLSADHRIVDGAEGARFLVEVKRLLDNPLRFLV